MEIPRDLFSGLVGFRGMTSADWGSLPCEIVQAIGNRLGAIEDFLAITAVCRSWRSAFSNKKIWNPGIPRLPLLMLPQSVDGIDPWLQPLAAATYFFSSERNKLYIIDVPEIHGRRCFGSQIGWIFTVNECVLDHEAHLVNPLSRLRILLPPLSSLKPWFEPNNFVRKAVTFHHRYLNIVVMAICGDIRNLALARPGYSTWVPVELETPYPCFEDVVCYGGDQIFGVRKDGSLVLCEIDDEDTATPPKAKAVSFAPALDRQQLQRVEEVRGKKVYLVESEGDLLLVLRLWRDPPLLTQEVDVSSFIIFKLNFGTREWVELERQGGFLGNRTLFVGDSYSMSFSARHGLRCQPNSIYYSDDFPHWSGLHFNRKARARPQAGGRISFPCYMEQFMWPNMMPYNMRPTMTQGGAIPPIFSKYGTRQSHPPKYGPSSQIWHKVESEKALTNFLTTFQLHKATCQVYSIVKFGEDSQVSRVVKFGEEGNQV